MLNHGQVSHFLRCIVIQYSSSKEEKYFCVEILIISLMKVSIERAAFFQYKFAN